MPPDVQTVAPTRSLGADVWDYLRRNPLFWVSAALIVLFVVMAAFPQLFTSKDPFYCDLNMARQPPGEDAIFGYDIQGCDVYARTIYGARASILVGVLTAVVTAILGSALGTTGGYIGRWIDTVLSRTADIFFAIPLLLGGIVILYSWKSDLNDPYALHVGKVVIALAVLGWPNIYRLMRSSVLQTRPLEYVQAARALGANAWRVVTSHIIPNSMAPVIVVSTIDLGAYIATEATLSFLGIGLPSTIISWGQAISNASGLGFVRSAPHMLLFPSIFLSLTVLSFIMLGEVVRDAMDPKLR
ncbi:MAG: ABC transporter permease [Propionicimonas sp.]|uniref:ABC transporter permease n=1 Tax=Propionicimonas sp. TaxID=1955623 RepID=UPI002B20130E|nr:ABC transporter permease [Propionicimonas sp.]MEA4944810.1 ABC transporter permease [Propionicimonas sp.]MEA5054562.1 ABC transporter permease [Propionicimonas sp.]MEA5119285.1 ABC transporter permease [Propionicimonas sp.]